MYKFNVLQYEMKILQCEMKILQYEMKILQCEMKILQYEMKIIQWKTDRWLAVDVCCDDVLIDRNNRNAPTSNNTQK